MANAWRIFEAKLAEKRCSFDAIAHTPENLRGGFLQSLDINDFLQIALITTEWHKRLSVSVQQQPTTTTTTGMFATSSSKIIKNPLIFLSNLKPKRWLITSRHWPFLLRRPSP